MTPEQQRRFDAIKTMCEHEPLLTPAERAAHIELERVRIEGKPSTVVNNVVPLHERTDGWRAR